MHSADMDETLRSWGANVARFRKQFGMTQQALADEVGVGQATIARWEAGGSEPKRRHKVILAEVFHTDVVVLFPLTRSAA